MKRNVILTTLIFTLSILITGVVSAQVPTDQDCLGAIPVCQDIYVQPNSYSGTGNYPNEIPTSGSCPGNCLSSGEKNDVWYIFTVQTGGLLSFTITPNNLGNDYDWAVYSLDQYKCQDIYTHTAQMQVSCNYSGTPGVTGPNGGSTQSCQGAGGSPFCAKIPVGEGETYVINISNFSSSQSGYTLDFTTSTAVIFDDVPPALESVETDDIICGSTTLTFDFTEKVLCNTVQASNFNLTGPGGPYTITDIYGDDCEIGGEMEITYHITFTPPIQQDGEYALEIKPLSFIQDACGNNAMIQSFPFDVDLNSPTAEAGEDIDIAYSGSTTLNGSAFGGTGEFSYTWTPLEKLEDPYVEDPTTVNLTESTQFTLNVVDDNTTCASSDQMMVNIVGGPMSVNAIASPAAVCAGDQTNLTANVDGGSGNFTYVWSSNPAGFESDIANPSASPMETTTYYVEVDDGFTIITAEVTVNVLPKPIIDAGVDQTINVGTTTNLNGSASGAQAPYSYIWEPSYMLDGSNTIQNPLTVILNEPQNYTLQVTDANGCPGEPDVVLINAAGDALAAFPQADPDEICIGESTTLHGNPSGGGGENYSLTWTSSDPDWSAEGDNVVISPTETTTYFVEVDDGYTVAGSYIVVPVHPLPIIDLIPAGFPTTGQDTIVACVRDTVVLDAGNASNPPDMNYLWSNNLSNRYLTAKTNGSWIDFQTYNVEVTNPLTTCSNTSEITIIFDFNQCEIGVEEISSLSENISIIPNPTGGMINLNITNLKGEIDIVISDITGKTILNKENLQLENSNFTQHIDLSKNPAGVYIIKIKHSSGDYFARIIKQ